MLYIRVNLYTESFQFLLLLYISAVHSTIAVYFSRTQDYYCTFQYTVLFKYFLFKFLFTTRFIITVTTSKETTFFSLRTIIDKLLSSCNYH